MLFILINNKWITSPWIQWESFCTFEVGWWIYWPVCLQRQTGRCRRSWSYSVRKQCHLGYLFLLITFYYKLLQIWQMSLPQVGCNAFWNDHWVVTFQWNTTGDWWSLSFSLNPVILSTVLVHGIVCVWLEIGALSYKTNSWERM